MYYSQTGRRMMSRPAVRVARGAIAVGIAVMIATIFIVVGFKHEVTSKVVGFGSHLQVVSFDSNNTYELRAIEVSDSLLDVIRTTQGVRRAEPFVTKPALIKTADAFQGVVLKGHRLPIDIEDPLSSKPDDNFWTFFSGNLTEGTLPTAQGQVLLSASLARHLQLGVDSTFLCYFIGDNIRARRYRVSGLYETGLKEADDMFVLSDIRDLQRLQGWDSTQVSGIDIVVDDFSRLSETYDNVYMRVANRFDEQGNTMYVTNVVDRNPAIFSWLALLDTNVVVIILLMLAVAGMNIISGLIILILGSIEMIGIFKSLGASNTFLQRVFLLQGSLLISEGLLIGNAVGLALCALQYLFRIVPLDPTSYYVSYVPVSFEWGWWLLLNIATMAVSVAILIAPARLVTRISPAQIMRYE